MKYNEFIAKLDETQISSMEKYPLLRIDEKLTPQELARGKFDLNFIPIAKNEIWLGCQSINNNVMRNAKFKLLIPYHNIEDPISINCELIYIYIQMGQTESSEFLPKGKCAACLVKFKDVIPKEFNNIPKTESLFDKVKNEIYFLAEDRISL